MIIKLKGDASFIEADSEFTDDMIDTLDNEINSAENDDLGVYDSVECTSNYYDYSLNDRVRR